MSDQEILDRFNADFEYVRDPVQFDRSEHWRIPTTPVGTPVRDDCDGYATGLLYRLVGEDEAAFWAALEDGTAAIVKVWARYEPGGETQGSHAVLRWRGQYVDNIFPAFRSDLIHELNRVYSSWDVRAKMLRSGSIAAALDSSKKRAAVILGAAALIMAAFALLG